MTTTLSILLLAASGVAILAGTLFLAVSLRGNWKSAIGNMPTRRQSQTARFAGGFLLIAGFACSLPQEGAGFAVLLWFLLFASVSMITALALSYRTRVAHHVARIIERVAST